VGVRVQAPIPMNAEQSLTLWQNQVKLFFSRFQTLAALEVAAYGGWYKVCYDGHTTLASVVLFVGFGLSSAILWVMWYDWKDAAYYRGIFGDLVLIERKPPKIGGVVVYGMWFGLGLGGVLVVVNLIFWWLGCACVLGEFWSCRI